MKEAIGSYVQEVKDGSFPEEKHTYKIDESELNKLY